MGASLALARLWMSEGKAPDWGKAEEALDVVTDDELCETYKRVYGVHFDTDAEGIREKAREALETAKAAWDLSLRCSADVSIPGTRIVVVGGNTWGDDVEEADDIDFLASLGVLQKAGFFEA